MRFSRVLLHHHLPRDPADFTKLAGGVNAQALMPDPVFDGAQQRRSQPVGGERMLLVTAGPDTAGSGSRSSSRMLAQTAMHSSQI
jgi:hypothetical protein